MIYQYKYYYFFYKQIKSFVLGLKIFSLSVLSLLSVLIFSYFLSDLSALVVKIFLSNHVPQVSSFLNYIFVIEGYELIHYALLLSFLHIRPILFCSVQMFYQLMAFQSYQCSVRNTSLHFLAVKRSL